VNKIGAEAIIVDEQGEVFMTDGIKKMISPKEEW
jgi:hypothetical protein